MDVVDKIEHIQGPQGVQHHLLVVISGDTDPFAEFQVHDLQHPLRYDDSVAGAETLRDIGRNVDLFLDTQYGLFVPFPSGLILLPHKSGVALGMDPQVGRVMLAFLQGTHSL